MQMVVAFHYFVDLCTDAGVAYNGEPAKLSAYEQASAAFIFFNFLLSVAATAFAVRVCPCFTLCFAFTRFSGQHSLVYPLALCMCVRVLLSAQFIG